jgi:N-acetylglutamate synthase-like GNAT family acetyltransferase
MIRKVKAQDFDQILNLGRQLFKEKFADKFSWNEQDARTTLWRHILQLYMLVEEENDRITGFISGSIYTEPFDYNKRIFHESLWYSSTNGMGLFSTLVRKLKDDGIDKVMFPSPAGNERLAEFYKKTGFQEVERQWIKELL